MKPTQSHWRRCETHAGASSVAADADVVDRIALGQKPCRLRRQLYSITGFLLFASSASSFRCHFALFVARVSLVYPALPKRNKQNKTKKKQKK